MIDKNHTDLLKNALQGTGFVRRGAAFFRVWGDGVLQVLKFERQRVFHVHDLNVGVFSMYGRLSAEWFTSRGCIPRGSIAGFAGLQSVENYLSPSRFTKIENGNYLYDGFPVTVEPKQMLVDKDGERWRYCFTPEQQVHILIEKVLPWLNEMTSQSLAAKAMFEINAVPNDALRFDAHLAAGEWTQAEQTLSAILMQHADARASWERTFSKDEFAKMAAQQEAIDEPLTEAWKMLQEKDKEAIASYLRENYKRNCALAKFCMK